MMGNAAPLAKRNLVGADIESAIHSCRIATDDFAAAPDGKLDAERAFARRRRSKDSEYRRAQGLIPEDDEADDEPEQNQQTELLRPGRENHDLT
jgi:hypothetical protein